MTLRKPNVLIMRAASVFMNSAPTAEPKVIRPDWNGVRPKPTCSSSGSRNGSEPMPSRNRKPPMIGRAHRLQPQQAEIQHREATRR